MSDFQAALRFAIGVPLCTSEVDTRYGITRSESCPDQLQCTSNSLGIQYSEILILIEMLLFLWYFRCRFQALRVAL